jgi:preprotein translocase subunit YajC
VEALNLLLLALALGLAFLILTRGSAARRSLRETQQSLRPGMQVMTGSGLYASVVEVEPDVVVLETAPGQHSRWDRRAVIRVIPQQAPAENPGETRDEPDEPGAP